LQEASKLNAISPRILIFTALLSAVFAVAGCDSNNGAAEGSDSTATALAGNMESDAENFGETDGQKADAKAKEEPKKKKERSTSIQASVVVSGDLVVPVIAEGTIRARHSAEINTEISGKITRIYVDEGQKVRRGHIIAKLDDREYEAAVEEARAAYLQALSLLTIEGEDLEFTELTEEIREEFADLHKQERTGKITREQRIAREVKLDIDAIKGGKFRYEVAAARSGVSVARANLERARINLERTVVRAPFDGVITGLMMSRGERVTVSDIVCSIVDNENIEAEVGVLEADLRHVEVGKSVLLNIPALDLTIAARVDVVSPQFDRESRTCQVLIRIKNPDGRLRPGMFVRAQVAGETFRDRLLVPREAILMREGRPLLFKVEDKRARWLYVKIGEGNDHLVEVEKVLQGGTLEPGDKVIVSDHLTLAHEAKIKVKKTLPLADPWIQLSSKEREDG